MGVYLKEGGVQKRKHNTPAAVIRHHEDFRKVHLTVIKSGRETDLQSEFPQCWLKHYPCY